VVERFFRKGSLERTDWVFEVGVVVVVDDGVN
jgi:hypothetical protein